MELDPRKSVGIVVLDDMDPFSIVTPYETFLRARSETAQPLYDVKLCAPKRLLRTGVFELRAEHPLKALYDADLIIVPSLSDVPAEVPQDLVRALQDAAARGARIAATCTGAFALGAAGLLDGLRATAHSRSIRALAERFPAARVDADVLFTDNGQVLTSGPGAAIIDMCLHIVRQDFGAAAAARAAREAALPLERHGGQAQLIVFHPHDAGTRLAGMLQWMSENLAENLDVETIAKKAGMSTRTLRRRFFEQTRTTPKQWLLDARLRHAQELLETTEAAIESIAKTVGFRSAAVLRERFAEVVGMTPSGYRRAMASVSAPTKLPKPSR